MGQHLFLAAPCPSCLNKGADVLFYPEFCRSSRADPVAGCGTAQYCSGVALGERTGHHGRFAGRYLRWFFLAYSRIPGQRIYITLLNTLLALPTVVIGLFVYMFISRRGVFGSLGLLYTQKAIIIGQFILIVPLITALTIAAISRVDERYRNTAKTLGANAWQTALVVLREGRFGIAAAVISAFGRVISEIGISMMLGGNIKGYTRTMTTAMALEYDKGSFTLAIALGLVLMALSLLVNILFQLVQGRSRR